MKPKLYPLRFTPILKERIWGGNKLLQLYNKESYLNDGIGESWEISGVLGDVSSVANGHFKGRNLNELIHQYGAELLGTEVSQNFGNQFPVLIKYIDAKEDLSIQLHPDDALAKKRHQSLGKTEMWYIMHAEADAKLALGFKKGTDQKDYKKALAQAKLTDIIHYQSVKAGEVFFIAPGLVHAIGGGIVLAEIQQTSDVTYRVYDYNRKDAQGNLRELHTDLAKEAIKFELPEPALIDYDVKRNQNTHLVHCPHFKTDLLAIDQKIELTQDNASFSIIMSVENNSILQHQQRNYTLNTGQSILIPASIDTVSLAPAEGENSSKLLQIKI
ncbi:MAG: type I phosphomannose isomerase catalytic subunit [Flavobacteriaceae bacterium]|nr:type I phosphomannose isomerase catalytic subunit [Flavobacteriaceae bacterium]